MARQTRIVQDQLNTAFLDRDPLSDVQFGFRRQRSTVQLLSVALNDWMLARDKGLSTAVVFVDLSKAFDRVRHQEIIVASGGWSFRHISGLVCQLPF